MMKKRLVSISTWILVLGAGAVGAQQAGPATAGEKAQILGHEKPTQHNVHYLDENGQIQRGTRCSTPESTDAEKARVRAEVEAWLDSHFLLKTATVIPVAFHVVHNSSEGDVTTTQINDQIDVLNTAFAGTAFSFYLASTDYTNSNNWFTRCGQTGWEKKMKKALAIDPAHTLNLYTCKPGQGAFGWSYMPWSYSEDSYWHGPVVHFQTLPGGTYAPFNLGDTATHEVGHFLGLWHTFEGGCNNNNEGVDDTPPEASAASGCPVGRDTCAGDGPDPIHNFMDYTDDACIYEFTPGQDTRMQTMTATYRPSLGT